MTPLDQINEAKRNWEIAESKIPEHEYEKGYKSRNATARKKWDIFSDLCKAQNLNPVEVAQSDLSNKIDLTK